MSDHVVFRVTRLGPTHRPTGNTRHYRNGQLLPPPVSLQIAQYPDDAGYYLFYLDGDGEVQADTYHDSVEDALDQAEFEFGVRPDEWEVRRA